MFFCCNSPILCSKMPKGGRPSVRVWEAVGTWCQRLCSNPMKFTPSLLKSALLLDPVTNESNLGWVPLTWPWPVQTIGQTQPVEKMFCTNEPSGGHRSVKKERIMFNLFRCTFIMREAHSLFQDSAHVTKKVFVHSSRLMDPEGAIGICF